MLKEALQYLLGQAADHRKAGLRVLKTPGGIPGRITYINANADGVYDIDTHSYDLAPKQYQARTIEGLCGFIFNSLPADTVNEAGGKPDLNWHVMIGESEVRAYRAYGEAFENADLVVLPLEETEEYKFFGKTASWKPSVLKKTIEKMFDENDQIYSLVPMLSKISVRETKTTTQSTSKSNESLGLDVQRDLSIDKYGEELPGKTFVRINKFNEIEVPCTIDLNIHFDFDNTMIVLTPRNYSLRAADITTNNAIREMIAKGEPKPIISEVTMINPNYSNDSQLL